MRRIWKPGANVKENALQLPRPYQLGASDLADVHGLTVARIKLQERHVGAEIQVTYHNLSHPRQTCPFSPSIVQDGLLEDLPELTSKFLNEVEFSRIVRPGGKEPVDVFELKGHGGGIG